MNCIKINSSTKLTKFQIQEINFGCLINQIALFETPFTVKRKNKGSMRILEREFPLKKSQFFARQVKLSKNKREDKKLSPKRAKREISISSNSVD